MHVHVPFSYLSEWWHTPLVQMCRPLWPQLLVHSGRIGPQPWLIPCPAPIQARMLNSCGSSNAVHPAMPSEPRAMGGH